MKLLFLTLSLFTATALFSQKQTIQLNLSVGITYSHFQQNKMQVVETVNGQDQVVAMDLSAKTSYYISAAHDSVYDMMVSYESLDFKTNTAQGQVELSSDGSKQDPMSKMFEAMVHKPFLMVMTKQGRIVEMHVDSLVESIPAGVEGITPQQKELLKANLKKTVGGEATKGSFEMVTAIYPAKPVGINSSWSTKTKLQSLTQMDLNGHYTLRAVKPSSLVLHGDVDMVSAKQDSATMVNGMPLYYDLSGKMTTDFEVDKASGWIMNGTISQSLKGTIKFLDSPKLPGGLDIPASIETQMALTDK